MVSSSSGEISSAPREARRHSTSKPAAQHPLASTDGGKGGHVPAAGTGGKQRWWWVLVALVLPPATQLTGYGAVDAAVFAAAHRVQAALLQAGERAQQMGAADLVHEGGQHIIAAAGREFCKWVQTGAGGCRQGQGWGASAPSIGLVACLRACLPRAYGRGSSKVTSTHLQTVPGCRRLLRRRRRPACTAAACSRCPPLAPLPPPPGQTAGC